VLPEIGDIAKFSMGSNPLYFDSGRVLALAHRGERNIWVITSIPQACMGIVVEHEDRASNIRHRHPEMDEVYVGISEMFGTDVADRATLWARDYFIGIVEKRFDAKRALFELRRYYAAMGQPTPAFEDDAALRSAWENCCSPC